MGRGNHWNEIEKVLDLPQSQNSHILKILSHNFCGYTWQSKLTGKPYWIKGTMHCLWSCLSFFTAGMILLGLKKIIGFTVDVMNTHDEE